jgi:hypothetical protein
MGYPLIAYSLIVCPCLGECMAFPIKAITVALAFLNYAQLRYHFYFVLAVYYIYLTIDGGTATGRSVHVAKWGGRGIFFNGALTFLFDAIEGNIRSTAGPKRRNAMAITQK